MNQYNHSPSSGGRPAFKRSFNKFSSKRNHSGGGFSRGGSGGNRGFKRSGNGGGFNRGRNSSFNVSNFINKNPTKPVEEKAYEAKHTFADFNLHPELLKLIEIAKYTSPTPIQDNIIKVIKERKDIIGLANTGTGKTAAFLIPLIDRILSGENKPVLILTPTRELAIQIEDEIRKLTRRLNIYSVACVGGVNIFGQLKSLRKFNHFIVGTPGRVLDLINRRSLNLNGVGAVVLDEADRMLDMGFIGDIRKILSSTPKERQTLCFSATMSKEIESLTNDFLKNPEKILVKTQDITNNIEQDVVRVNGRDKTETLTKLLLTEEFTRVIVFGKTKHGVERLSQTLVKSGIKAESIHGNKSHGQRQRALKQFKESHVRILVATDVAARGIHVDDVSHVINFDLPATYEDYVHRIGRTGRGKNKGKALTFVDR
jgi:ATP-dependent RNA helicase RhlE